MHIWPKRFLWVVKPTHISDSTQLPHATPKSLKYFTVIISKGRCTKKQRRSNVEIASSGLTSVSTNNAMINVPVVFTHLLNASSGYFDHNMLSNIYKKINKIQALSRIISDHCMRRFINMNIPIAIRIA